MKPKFDSKIKRPDGKRYDMGAPTNLAATFARIRREQAAESKKQEAAAQERRVKVRKIA